MIKKSKAGGLSSRLRTRGFNRDKLFLILEKYGRLGVGALKDATPKESGATAESWTFTVDKELKLTFKNSETTSYGVPIPKLLMYGYLSKGRNVVGDDFVRRALDPIIKSLREEIRKEML